MMIEVSTEVTSWEWVSVDWEDAKGTSGVCGNVYVLIWEGAMCIYTEKSTESCTWDEYFYCTTFTVDMLHLNLKKREKTLFGKCKRWMSNVSLIFLS